jgi:hypothetical protein
MMHPDGLSSWSTDVLWDADITGSHADWFKGCVWKQMHNSADFTLVNEVLARPVWELLL